MALRTDLVNPLNAVAFVVATVGIAFPGLLEGCGFLAPQCCGGRFGDNS